MVVEIHHGVLSSLVARALPIARNEIINGFLLLKHLDLLEECFRGYKVKVTGDDWLVLPFLPVGTNVYDFPVFPYSPVGERLQAETSLLVEGFLKDPQVFTSFDFGRLFEEGYLSYDRWKKFLSSLTKENIDLLEASYSDEYEDQDLSHPCSHNPQKILLTKALLEAINNGHENIVSLLLDHGAEIDGTGSTKPELGLPLRSAVYAGNSNVINLLLSRGAVIGNVWLEDTIDHWLIAKSLIDHGVDPHHLVISLNSHSNKSADKRLVKIILASRLEVETHNHQRRNLPQRRLRRFHSAFRQEYSGIIRCAQSWTKEYCGHRKKAFGEGISVLRGLCKGQLPSTVNETIWFLAIAKSMSFATSNVSPRNYEQSQILLRLDERARRCNTLDFSEDLGRWQMVFENDWRSLAQFRIAIASVWHVDLHDTRVLRPDPSTLKEFCDLAYGILQNLDDSFDDSSHGSGRLLANQEQWRVHMFSKPHAEISDEQARTSTDGPPPMSCGAHHFAWYKDREPLPLSVPDIPIREAISNDQRLWSTKPLVRLLMAGAVFCIIITFLLGAGFFFS